MEGDHTKRVIHAAIVFFIYIFYSFIYFFIYLQHNNTTMNIKNKIN